jgi:uncharacterized protein (DUF488 family)
MTPDVLTVGHSTRSLEELLELLRAAGVERLVDVRRFPASKRHPHFGREPLSRALAQAGIDYVWMEALGGRRSRRKDSPHVGWRVPAFAGYADYMETGEFRTAVAELVRLAGEKRTAILCAEARPEQCHRRLIADWLVSHGARVAHVMTAKRLVEHAVPPFLRLDGDRLVYDRHETLELL